jgi:hypothetical protein
MDLYARLPEWIKRAFFPARYESELIEVANHDAYIAANESLMSWVFSMHNHYFNLNQALSWEQNSRSLSETENDQLHVARYFMLEFENLGAFIASFPEGTWVRMRMVDGYLRERHRLLPEDAEDRQRVVLQQLLRRFDIMMKELPEYAR